MKKLLLILSVLLSSEAYATGGFSCEFSPNTLSTLSIYATTARVSGDALLDGIQIYGSGDKYGHIDKFIERSYVSNYKNYYGELFILALDDQVEKTILLLNYNPKTEKTYALFYDETNGMTYEFKEVQCEEEG